MPSRLAVLIVADLVDYSRLMSEDEARAIGTVRELKEEILEPKMTEQGGEILKRMGDGWIIAFTSVTAATQCAMTVQESLAAHPLIKLRMGMHIGEIVEDDTDFYGAGVNLAQRLQTEAPPGGIMVSQDLHRQLTGDLAKAFTDAGSFKLKNIAEPVNGFQWRPRIDGGNPGEVPTIAIERFAYAPQDVETEAITEDLRDQLLLRLSKRSGIRVLDEAGAAANKSVYFLRGRLRMSGSRGRLNLSLVVRENANAIWTQSYDGDADDVFAFCDGMIEKSVADLRIQINAFDNDRIADLPDDQLSISELRSRAAANFYKCTVESWEQARQLLDRAVGLNPDDPMALAMRAHATAFLAGARFEDLSPDRIESLRADLDRAVEAAPRSDYIFTARSVFRSFITRDVSGAMKDADRALSLNPGYHIAYDTRGMARMLAGDMENAFRDLEKARSLSEADPLMPYRLFMLSIAYNFSGRPEKALETVEHALQLRSSQHSYFVLKAAICRSVGRGEEAENAEAHAAGLPKAPAILAPRPPLPERYADFVESLSPN